MKDPKPTDHDLMRLYDGDLDDEARTDVQAAVVRDPASRAKLAALKLAGELVREEALRRADAADGIADRVMARIASADPDARRRDDADPAPSGKVVPLRGRGSRPDIAPPSAASNDNGAARRIYALAVAAVAVAAGLMIWGKMDPPAPTALPNVPTEVQPLPSAIAQNETETARPRPSGARSDDGPEAGEGEVGVQVAAVDFGARAGSIFYVPTQGRTTTVVWLADDLAGGE